MGSQVRLLDSSFGSGICSAKKVPNAKSFKVEGRPVKMGVEVLGIPTPRVENTPKSTTPNGARAPHHPLAQSLLISL